MATKSSTETISSLVINRVASAAVFADMIANNQVNDNELYLVEGDDAVITYTISKSGGTITLAGSDGSASTVTVPTATSDLTNDSGFITSSDVPSASTTAPSMDGTASYGSGTTWARSDHVHPTDTTRAPTSHSSTATTYGIGTGTYYGHVKLSDSTSSSSAASAGIAATPAAVKAAYDHGGVTSVNGATGAVTVTVPEKVSDLTNDSGYISSYTETDPVFSASAASGITSSDITNWNGKTSNTGTITGVSANGTSVATSGVANIPAASTSAYGVTKLSSSTSSTSTALAATASAVKAAYDHGGVTSVNGNTGAVTISKADLTSVSISVAASAWAASSDSTITGMGYGYYADVTVSGLDASDSVSVNFDKASIAVGRTAGVAGFCDISANTVRLYSVNKPSAAMTGTVEYIHEN